MVSAACRLGSHTEALFAVVQEERTKQVASDVADPVGTAPEATADTADAAPDVTLDDMPRHDAMARSATPLSATPDATPHDAPDVQRDAILHLTTLRLVWSRKQELEALQSKLRELGDALLSVDDVRRQLEERIAEDLRDASELSASRRIDGSELHFRGSFSHYFNRLVGSLSSAPSSSTRPSTTD